ncbi:hypothetical protein Hanom_Chr17g01528751 [Helianthus anomalus]
MFMVELGQPMFEYIGRFCMCCGCGCGVGCCGCWCWCWCWCGWLLPLSSDDSLDAPSDGGLIPGTAPPPPLPPPKLNMFGGATGDGPMLDFGFFASAMKLPTIT